MGRTPARATRPSRPSTSPNARADLALDRRASPPPPRSSHASRGSRNSSERALRRFWIYAARTVVQTLTKKQAWKENDEWVVVGLKESKSVERGWIVVPDKAKRKPDPPPIEEPDRVDKILARCASHPRTFERER